MLKRNNSEDWYFNEVTCLFNTAEEIAEIIQKVNSKRLIKILFSEIKEFREAEETIGKEFGYYKNLYNMNLYLRNIIIIKDYEDYRKHIYQFEFNDHDTFSQVYFIKLNFLDKLYFQQI